MGVKNGKRGRYNNELEMSVADIVKEYREAKSKRNEIEVLADLNDTVCPRIAFLLDLAGENVSAGMLASLKTGRTAGFVELWKESKEGKEAMELRERNHPELKEPEYYEIDLREIAGSEHEERADKTERCILCGAIIPEGRQVCPQCEAAERTEIPQEPLVKLKRPVERLDDKPVEPAAMQEPHIMDSGERREFATGAVRDIQDGKGRCDLLPLDIVEELIGGQVLGNIQEFQETQSTYALHCALYNFMEMRYRIVDGDASHYMAEMVLDVSKHFEEGAKKYGEYNWQKGIPVHCYIDSAVRHFLKWCRGDKDEPHDRAFVWNILCLLWTLKHIENAEV